MQRIGLYRALLAPRMSNMQGFSPEHNINYAEVTTRWMVLCYQLGIHLFNSASMARLAAVHVLNNNMPLVHASARLEHDMGITSVKL